jgi:hypothetical protein
MILRLGFEKKEKMKLRKNQLIMTKSIIARMDEML